MSDGASLADANWLRLRFHGDYHVIPKLDRVVHTVPLCACQPQVINGAGDGPLVYSHYALDGRG